MLTEYIKAAMRHAKYEVMEDGNYFGTIPPVPGVWAGAETVEACREERREVLEDWITVALAPHVPIPPVDGIEVAVRPAV